MSNRPRTARRVRFVAAFAVIPVVVSGLIAAPGPAAVAAAKVLPPAVSPGSLSPVPAPRTLPAAMDVQQQYEGQSICDPVIKPGVRKLQDLLTKTYGPRTFYSTRACAADPTSEHTEGRALDWMVSVRVPDQKSQADAFLTWLLAPDAQGIPGANARRMGIMYIAWNSQFWRAYDPIGWTELRGCLAKNQSAAAYDTDCHRNHVHFSMTWDGAAAATSYWDGTAQTVAACPSSFRSGSAPKAPGPLVQVSLPEVTIFDTRTGLGNGGRVCRLQEDRWAGDNHRLTVKVTGRGRIPKRGSYVATVRITAVDPNAPMRVFAWPTGKRQPARSVLSTTLGQSSSQVADVRIGADGYVSIATATGDTDITVSLLGYRRLA